MFTGSTHTQRRWGHLYKGKENNIGSSFSFKSCLSHLPSLDNYSSNILYSITYKNATFPWLNPFSFSLNTSANLSAYHGKPSRVCFPNFGVHSIISYVSTSWILLSSSTKGPEVVFTHSYDFLAPCCSSHLKWLLRFSSFGCHICSDLSFCSHSQHLK